MSISMASSCVWIYWFLSIPWEPYYEMVWAELFSTIGRFSFDIWFELSSPRVAKPILSFPSFTT